MNEEIQEFKVIMKNLETGAKKNCMYSSTQGFVLLNFYCNKNAIIAIFAIIANNQ